MVKDAMIDLASPGKRRDDDARDAEPAQRQRRIDIGGTRRRDVVEEAAPLVVGDHERGRAPLRAGDDRVVRASEKRLARTDVGEGVVVLRETVLAALAKRVDESDVRQPSRFAVVEEIGIGVEDVVVSVAQCFRNGSPLPV